MLDRRAFLGIAPLAPLAFVGFSVLGNKGGSAKLHWKEMRVATRDELRAGGVQNVEENMVVLLERSDGQRFYQYIVGEDFLSLIRERADDPVRAAVFHVKSSFSKLFESCMTEWLNDSQWPLGSE